MAPLDELILEILHSAFPKADIGYLETITAEIIALIEERGAENGHS